MRLFERPAPAAAFLWTLLAALIHFFVSARAKHLTDIGILGGECEFQGGEKFPRTFRYKKGRRVSEKCITLFWSNGCSLNWIRVPSHSWANRNLHSFCRSHNARESEWEFRLVCVWCTACLFSVSNCGVEHRRADNKKCCALPCVLFVIWVRGKLNFDCAVLRSMRWAEIVYLLLRVRLMGKLDPRKMTRKWICLFCLMAECNCWASLAVSE